MCNSDTLIKKLAKYKEFCAILAVGIGGAISAFQFFVTQTDFNNKLLETQKNQIEQVTRLQCLLIANVAILNGSITEVKTEIELDKLDSIRKAISKNSPAISGDLIDKIVRDLNGSEGDHKNKLAEGKKRMTIAQETLNNGQCSALMKKKV